MTDLQIFGYTGKRVLVVGGATGMGAAAARAAADLGAEVVVMDRAPVDFPVAETITVDLQDRAVLDAALDRLDGPLDAVFSAAGVADGPALMRINFIAHRHLIERLVAEGTLGRGSAVCLISSVAGLGWQNHLPRVVEFLSSPDFETADKWIASHEGTNTYTFSKQAVNAYVAREAFPLMAKGVRINAICPGPTDTPLARANSWLDGFGADYRQAVGTRPLDPEQMANVMLFLNSPAAAGISGVNLLVDDGHIMSSIGGSWAAGGPVVDFLMSGASR
ncbi:SDR family oxidoreductase [Actinocorallia longicatena]|uniref:NAD-dependent epimerase/dehydratase domain-containing protein n=1 Tax=Actinocorallia longicatena TaxID=111803 RepID=A0ABP6QGL6_9ACTN